MNTNIENEGLDNTDLMNIPAVPKQLECKKAKSIFVYQENN